MKILMWLFLFTNAYSFAQTNEFFIERIKRKCDQQIAVRLGEENFKKYVLQNDQQSEFECADGNTYPLSEDSIDCEIKSIKIVYDIVKDQSKLFTLSFISDSLGNIHCPENNEWRYYLEGYKELIHGSFPINYEHALDIVKSKNYDPIEFELELVYANKNFDDLKAYEWHGSKYLGNNITKMISVNAFTGEFREVLIEFVSDEN